MQVFLFIFFILFVGRCFSALNFFKKKISKFQSSPQNLSEEGYPEGTVILPPGEAILPSRFQQTQATQPQFYGQRIMQCQNCKCTNCQ